MNEHSGLPYLVPKCVTDGLHGIGDAIKWIQDNPCMWGKKQEAAQAPSFLHTESMKVEEALNKYGHILTDKQKRDLIASQRLAPSQVIDLLDKP